MRGIAGIVDSGVCSAASDNTELTVAFKSVLCVGNVHVNNIAHQVSNRHSSF